MNRKIWSVVFLGVFLRSALAVDILDTAENLFFSESDRTRVGIEIEFRGLSMERAAAILIKRLGGTCAPKTTEQLTTLVKIKDNGEEVYKKSTSTTYVIEGSSIGKVALKLDYNQTDDRQKIDRKDTVLELVTDPIRYPEVLRLQEAVNDLKLAGAQGTTPSLAVSIQVNAEIAEGRRANIDPALVVSLLQTYMAEEHREQIAAHLRIPIIRRKYLLAFSPGFTQRLLDPHYRPNLRQLYDDFIYRQTLELLGNGHAWKMPIAKVRAQVLKHPHPVIPSVVKVNPLRVSSLLMFAFPEDPMSKLYASSGWAVARPLVEFREWNNDFNVVSPTRQALGLIEASKQYGYYHHDRLLSALTGVDEEAVASLRNRVNENQRKGTSYFRYFLGDAHHLNRGDYKEQAEHYEGTQVGFISADGYGQGPMVIPGESVVFHRRHFHRHSVMGKYNPGLINYNLQQALENKYVEYRFWQEYAPNAMPRTELLADVVGRARNPEEIVRRLNERFPNGWVMKGVWDLGSEKEILSSDLDVVAEIQAFQSGDFLEFRDGVLAEHGAGGDAPEYMLSRLKEHAHYRGWQLSQRLSQPHLSMVQAKVAIAREFRVEVIAGRVLGKGSTIDRWRYLYQYGIGGRRWKDYVEPEPSTVRTVERFAQAIVDRLPEDLKGMPFGMDVAVLEDGKLTLIESNPGGNSNFLFEEEPESIHAMESFMRACPNLYRTGKIPVGLEPRAQMTYLKKQFLKWGVQTKLSYPGMTFLEDRIEDPDYSQFSTTAEDVKMEATDNCRNKIAHFGRAG